jgi:hypothetical protein
MLNQPPGSAPESDSGPQLSSAEANALQSALNRPPIGAPQPRGGVKHDFPNPILLDYRRIRWAIERTLENESDADFSQILHSWHLAIRERERGSSGAEIAQLLQQPMAPSPLVNAPQAPPPQPMQQPAGAPGMIPGMASQA